MYLLKPALAVAILCGAIWALNTRFGILPPLGKLLDPSTGMWRNAESPGAAAESSIRIPGLKQVITVRYDGNNIPHLFASGDYGLYFAQGYITARDRLWQMELSARTASGRLAEIFGGRTLNMDIFYRRIGLLYAAERALDSVLKDTATGTMLTAYTDGVNAYIHSLTPAQYPLEYKIFDCSPEEWRPLKCLLILKLMGETLTGGEPEFTMTNAMKELGGDVVKELFDAGSQAEEPVIPSRSQQRRPLFPGPSKAEIAGSNNWAVSGKKSASGFPLLANDPHLKLTLPSIWYQLQLKSSDCNIAGVSIPGVPGVVIGFNQHVAWGETNAAADVLDWYRIRFRDSLRSEYWYDGKWIPTSRRIESFRLNNGRTISDTILYTRQGPVVYDRTHKKNDPIGPAGALDGFVMRWTLHDISNDLKTIYLLNRARSIEDYRLAMTYFSCPAQNFVFADRDNNIAMTSSGKFPLRNREQGEFILDGSLPGDEWKGWIPMDQTPFISNPESGFLSSANQILTGPEYPYYIPGHFSLPYRARRINSRLAGMGPATVDSFRTLQDDTYSEMAAEVLPTLLRRLDGARIRQGEEVVRLLTAWDYRFDKDSKGATIFSSWWEELRKAIWKDDMDGKAIQLPWPDYRKTAMLILRDTNAHWIDDVSTPEKESLTDIVNASFQRTVYELEKKYGTVGSSWAWGNSRFCTIPYIGNIPCFGIGYNNTGGAPNTIDALSDRFGPSWRMVVELGPIVKGYGILPGGESGNPGSYYYDNQFESWRQGRLNELVFLDSVNDRKETTRVTLILK